MKLVAAFLQLIAAIDEQYCNSTELGFKGDLENCLCPNGFHLAHLAAYKESLQIIADLNVSSSLPCNSSPPPHPSYRFGFKK